MLRNEGVTDLEQFHYSPSFEDRYMTWPFLKKHFKYKEEILEGKRKDT